MIRSDPATARACTPADACAASGVGDDRGAIMIIGLLASIVLIGVIWLTMRLGDTIALREHAGGAADAIAFSASVVHARTMNVLVLLNLLMAAILTIRVALRALELAVVIAALPTFGASLAALPPLLAADAASAPGIIAALTSLGTTSSMMAASTPAMARAAAAYVGRTYRPLVKEAVVVSAGASAFDGVMGLPVEPDLLGTEECGRTVTFVGGFVRYPLDKIGMGGIANLILKPVKGLIGSGSFFFCGLGINIPFTIPGFDQLEAQAEDACRAQLDAAHIDPLSPDGQVRFKACTAASADVVAAADGAAQSIANNALNEAVGLIPPTTMKLSDWQNGDPFWQIVAVPTLDTSSLAPNAMVSLTGFGKRKVGGLPAGVDRAVAQSEFYYDCGSRWTEKDCSGPVEPMWNFRWRSRLVRVDSNAEVVKSVYDPLAAGIQNEIQRADDTNALDTLSALQDFLVH